jgi:hypothetical protein
MRHEHSRERGLLLKKELDFTLINSHDRAFAHRNSRRQALGLSDQTSFAKKLIGAEERDHGFLALLGHDDDFDFALFDIEDCVCRITLREDNVVLPVR